MGDVGSPIRTIYFKWISPGLKHAGGNPISVSLSCSSTDARFGRRSCGILYRRQPGRGVETSCLGRITGGSSGFNLPLETDDAVLHAGTRMVSCGMEPFLPPSACSYSSFTKSSNHLLDLGIRAQDYRKRLEVAGKLPRAIVACLWKRKTSSK